MVPLKPRQPGPSEKPTFRCVPGHICCQCSFMCFIQNNNAVPRNSQQPPCWPLSPINEPENPGFARQAFIKIPSKCAETKKRSCSLIIVWLFLCLANLLMISKNKNRQSQHPFCWQNMAIPGWPQKFGSFPNFLQPMLLCQQGISHGFAPQLTKPPQTANETSRMDANPRSKSIPSWVKNQHQSPVTACCTKRVGKLQSCQQQQKRGVFSFWGKIGLNCTRIWTKRIGYSIYTNESISPESVRNFKIVSVEVLSWTGHGHRWLALDKFLPALWMIRAKKRHLDIVEVERKWCRTGSSQLEVASNFFNVLRSERFKPTRVWW